VYHTEPLLWDLYFLSSGTLVPLHDAKKNLWTVAWSNPIIVNKADNIDLAIRRSLGSVQVAILKVHWWRVFPGRRHGGEILQVGDMVKAEKKIKF